MKIAAFKKLLTSWFLVYKCGQYTDYPPVTTSSHPSLQFTCKLEKTFVSNLFPELLRYILYVRTVSLPLTEHRIIEIDLGVGCTCLPSLPLL